MHNTKWFCCKYSSFCLQCFLISYTAAISDNRNHWNLIIFSAFFKTAHLYFLSAVFLYHNFNFMLFVEIICTPSKHWNTIFQRIFDGRYWGCFYVKKRPNVLIWRFYNCCFWMIYTCLACFYLALFISLACML